MSDLIELRDRLRSFAREREWEQFHTPRNMVLALAGEVGELAALIQWLPDDQVERALEDERLRGRFSDELADCLAYVIQIADRTGIALRESLESKIERNALKYPVDRSRGNAMKYTEFESPAE